MTLGGKYRRGTAVWHWFSLISNSVHPTDVVSNPKVVRTVVRVVEDGAFVHFYLACGHLITVRKDELKGALPRQMKCWACAQKNEKS
jgi:hypothetical protein